MRYVLLGLAACIVLATLLASLRSDRWWMRVFDFPRLQLGMLGFVVLLVHLSVYSPGSPWEMGLLTALALASAWQAYRMFWYTPLAPLQVLPARGAPDEAPDLRLMVANVLMSNRQAEGLLASIEREGPDLVLLLEPDAWWEERLRPLEAAFPWQVRRPQPNTYGMLLFSRRPLHEVEVRFLVEEDVPSIRARLALEGGPGVRLYCLHPRPPAVGQQSTWRDAELLQVARELHNEEGPALVCGDLNDVAWSHTTRLFQRISRLLDPRVGRGFYNSFHAEHRLLRYPLDHVFFSADFRLRRLARLPAFGSDHFPIVVELDYQPQGRSAHEAPEMEADDRREARARIRRAETDTEG